MLVETKRQAALISVRTGLKEDTCVDLLLSGWSFVQQNNGLPDQWVSSQGSLSVPTK
jgi:hypothetical protein